MLDFKGVAPFTGAWIETRSPHGLATLIAVAPFTGAWIETLQRRPKPRSFKSHPSRVRGLKQLPTVQGSCVTASHPSRVRGLKLNEALTTQAEQKGRTLHGCVD